MKKVILIAAAIFFAGTASIFAQESPAKKEVKQNANISEVTLSCDQDCGNCSEKVKKQLAFTKGVKFVSADYEKDIVFVKYRNDRTDVDKIITSLAEIGYAAKPLAPSCPNQKKGCCPGKTTEGESHSGCSGKATTGNETHTGCSGGSHAGCSGKTTEPVKN